MLRRRAHQLNVSLTPGLRAAIYDGFFYAVMVGLGETAIVPFAIALGAAPWQLSLVVSVPPFIGAIGQVCGLWATGKIESRRKLIIWAVMANALSWLFLAYLASRGSAATTGYSTLALPLIIFYAVYHLSGGLGTPAWNSLIGDIVPESQRGRYFGLRNEWMAFATFTSMLAVGYILRIAQGRELVFYGFSLVFICAACFRAITIPWLLQYDDPPHRHDHASRFSFWQFLLRMPYSNFARFVLYVAIVNGTVAFTAPFYPLYMLRDLHFTYTEFAVMTSTIVIVQFLTVTFWGRLSDSLGNKHLLSLLGFGTALGPLLWLVSRDFYFLLLVQLLNGCMWAGFNLAAANFLFEAVTPQKRARCTAYQAVVNGAVVMTSSLLGGLLVSHLPSGVSFGSVSWHPYSALYFLFIISSVVRFLSATIFLPRFQSPRVRTPLEGFTLLEALSAVKPNLSAPFGFAWFETRKR